MVLLNAASSFVPGNRGADMIRASALACCGDFLLRLASCQGKNLRLPPTGFAAAGRWRLPDRPGAVAFVACTEAVFLDAGLLL